MVKRVERLRAMNNPLVSVVIITRNREKELQRCIDSILNNAYENIELVVYDNSSRTSRKRTREFLSSLKFKGDIKYIESSPKGFAEMRQIAIDNSEGEIIMGIDDDCVAGKDAISQIVRCFMSDERIGIVGGNITNIGFKGESRFKGRGKIGINGKYEVVRDPKNAEVFGSANMSIRRKAFDEVGGYDLFFSGGLEEADLTLRIKRTGHKVVYEPGAKITHFYSPPRFRSKWRNMDVHRLYLFFKHFMPNDIIDWIQFFNSEFKILIGDMNRLMLKPIIRFGKEHIEDHASAKGDKGKPLEYLRVFSHILLELLKVIIARMIIPYLIYKAYKARSSQQKQV